MKIITKNIAPRNQTLILTNQRALYWQQEETLILSDVHIGKTAHFRKHGIPMPDDILQKDLGRFQTLIHHFNPKKIIVVGDLFHAERNSDMTTFKDWIRQFSDIEWILIKGNHDRLSNHVMEDLNINVRTELVINPFTFVHDRSEANKEVFTISGHIHPGVLIKGKGRQKLKLPCFQVTSSQIVLPAFSLFTGLNTKDIPENATCYVFTETSIFEF